MGGNSVIPTVMSSSDSSASSASDSDVEALIDNGSQSVSRSQLRFLLSKQKNKGVWEDPTAVCHVCLKPGHCAGFRDSVYIDCINKPCYLCKVPGHTTATCPHRILPNAAQSRSSNQNLARVLLGRCVNPWSPAVTRRVAEVSSSLPIKWHVSAAVTKVHKRRVSALAYHPNAQHLLISGDKTGEMVVMDTSKSYTQSLIVPHMWLINAIVPDPGHGLWTYSAAADGKIVHTSLETGLSNLVTNLNPLGWSEGMMASKEWRMFLSLAIDTSRGSTPILYGGDDVGRLHICDQRVSGSEVSVHALHKKNKITCLDVNPRQPELLVSCGNDYDMKLWDVRSLENPIVVTPHPRIVSSAYFSPITGSKLVSTCTDNRIRLWNNILHGNVDPTMEIVHSHDFARYLSPFKAVWDPKDHLERRVLCGRYISEDFNGEKLHPIDILNVDCSRGPQSGVSVVTQLVDSLLPTISPVNVFHPTRNIIASGSSRAIYIWTPVPGPDSADAVKTVFGSGPAGGGGDGDSSGEEGGGPRGGSSKRKAPPAAKKAGNTAKAKAAPTAPTPTATAAASSSAAAAGAPTASPKGGSAKRSRATPTPKTKPAAAAGGGSDDDFESPPARGGRGGARASPVAAGRGRGRGRGLAAVASPSPPAPAPPAAARGRGRGRGGARGGRKAKAVSSESEEASDGSDEDSSVIELTDATSSEDSNTDDDDEDYC